MDALASDGSYQTLADAARRGELTDDMVFDASIEAAVDSGNGAAFYGVNSGWSFAKLWHSFVNWLFGN
jgi:hypothetical protein